MIITPTIKKKEVAKNGMVNIKIRISHKHGTRFISTKYYILPNQINAKGKVLSHENADFINMELQKLCLEYNKKLYPINTEEMHINKIVEILNSKSEAHDFKVYFKKFIYEKQDLKKTGTATLYEATYHMIELFDGGAPLMFEDISTGWLADFETYMKKRRKGNKQNTVAIPLRNIRAVFNSAIIHGVIPRNVYPFQEFKIKQAETAKRALSIEQIRFIRDFKTKYAITALARDMFMLSFYLIGMNNTDLFELPDINNGRIDYHRAKTGKFYSIKIEPEAASLIKSLKGEKKLLNFSDIYKTPHALTHSLNKGIKRIIHSWATIASNDCDAGDDLIAAALGQTRKTVTDIYINRNSKKVDELNRKVLDCLLDLKKISKEDKPTSQADK
jgi:integrase